MTSNSSRRSFLKAGALVATPLAVGLPAVALAKEGQGDAKLSRLEDDAAIRRLHQDWLRQAHRGAQIDPSLHSIAPDPAGAPDAIEIAADGTRASGRYACTVETITALALDSTFAQMAHAQGGGSARTSERLILKVDYAKTADGWQVAGTRFAAI